MRARVLAPLVAAVLGIAGGVTTALVVPDDDGDAAAFADPLHLGIPMVDQPCSDRSLLVIGYGDTVAPLSNAVTNTERAGLRYLRGDTSCDTALGPEHKPTPTYVVYRGPYDSRQDACTIRMSATEPGSFVTVLRSGNEELVKCPCEIPVADAPVLSVGMDVDAMTTLWVRGLQAMFYDDDPEGFPHVAITGSYDAFTAAWVQQFQDDAPGRVTEDGVVDATTWDVLTKQLCRNYDY